MWNFFVSNIIMAFTIIDINFQKLASFNLNFVASISPQQFHNFESTLVSLIQIKLALIVLLISLVEIMNLINFARMVIGILKQRR